jgi:alkaline phosphatase D
MLTRRQFLARSGSAGAALVISPQAVAAPRGSAALLRGGRFNQGVLSGDPTPHGITLLTVLDEISGSGRVRLEVATDPDFRNVVARRNIATGERRAHSVKARLENLRPHERYWYRFETRDRHSPVGRFQTALPADSRETVRFGFFSCADFTHGYYNAYAALAREDLDFVVCLGDYIYAEVFDEVGGSGRAVRDDRIGKPNPYYPAPLREAGTLPEYRQKYALYRTDESLRRMHQLLPVVATWDDHEVQNNYANDADDGGLPLRRRFSRARRDAAYQAFFESMPLFARGGSRIYRTQRHGRTVELTMLDQRQYREDQPCSDALAFPCRTWDRARTMLGRRQLGFLKSRLAASRAVWKVVGGQSLIMPNRVHDGQYQRFDSWQGYPREREELLQHLAQRGIKDVIFLAGDVHTVVAGDVGPGMGAGPSVALEFASGSITSASVGETNYRLPGGQLVPGSPNPHTPPEIMAHYRALNPWFDALDLDRHGYGVVAASQSTFDVTLKRMWTVKERNFGTLPPTGFHWQVKRGQTSIKGTAV